MKPSEACAVFGVSLSVPNGNGEAAGIVYNGLLATQHRGQEAAGIAVLQGNGIQCQRGIGLVSEVFSGDKLSELTGGMAVGHTLYAVSDSGIRHCCQPFVTEFLTGRTAIALNGSVTNARKLRERLSALGISSTASCDGEVVSELVAYMVKSTGDVLSGVGRAASEIEGAFSMVVLSSDGKLVAVRDSSGFRPLCVGTGPQGTAFASESCALDSAGFTLVEDVMPGGIVAVENGEITKKMTFRQNRERTGGLCIFEFVYFARPDSIIDGLCVYEARFNMGKILAKEHPASTDVVCGVPDSGIEAALGYAAASGLPPVSGFVKNRYIGRSFIYPTKSQRENAVRLKLNPLKSNIDGKRIVLVDDSIVRGTTVANTIAALKGVGAKEVHLRISSPPFRYTCHWGTDIGDEKNLIANRLDQEKICQSIGADSLGYISREGLLEACAGCKLKFCTACFSGHMGL